MLSNPGISKHPGILLRAGYSILCAPPETQQVRVCRNTPKSGRFQEFPAAAGLGKKTPGMILTLGRAGRIKGSCSEELNAVIPRWLLLQREQHLDLSFQVFWAGGKRLQCASEHQGQEKASDSHSQPLPSKLSMRIIAPKVLMSLF